MKLRHKIRYFIRNEVSEPALFCALFILGLILLIGAMAMCSGCGPECAPAFSRVGDYQPLHQRDKRNPVGGVGKYTFSTTHILSNGVRVETHENRYADELNIIIPRVIECAEKVGPALTMEEMDWDHGMCITHLALAPRYPMCDCMRIKILPREECYTSVIDGVTPLLHDTVDLQDSNGCWIPKPGVNPDLPSNWPAGETPCGLIITAPRCESDEGCLYPGWTHLARAVIDVTLGCYNSPLVEPLLECIHLGDLTIIDGR
jgi:hypothetical protein